MKTFINLMIASFLSISMLVISGLFIILIYNELQNGIDILMSVAIFALAIWICYSIFTLVMRFGFIAFFSKLLSTPELDKMDPDENN